MRRTATAKRGGANSRARAPLVLVVDDFRDNREMYADYLAFKGYRVAEAEDGEEAVEQAIQLVPDLVVMDLALPRLDGLEATRKLKADPRTKKIPVLALTGHALAKVTRQAREVGCDAFLAKPCLPDALAKEIARMLRAARAREAKGKKA